MIQSGEAIGNDLEVVSGLKKGDKVVADQKSGRIEGRKVLVAEK
jgi:multidrug efflux pump subunit AcrA (membrane-fusion protein)